jgi:hypothetical protein
MLSIINLGLNISQKKYFFDKLNVANQPRGFLRRLN